MSYSSWRPNMAARKGAWALVLGAVLCLLITTDAAAADTPVTAPPSQQPPTAKNVESVYVTSARKTEERSIDVPVSSAGLNEEQLQRYNTTNLTQLTAQVPGVSIQQSGGGSAGGNMTIRGIGNLAGDYGAEQPVAFVLDGHSFTRGHIIDVGFFDLASVEVLKGPQTLYFGKNSPAGVISVTSISPGREFEGFARASYEFRSEDPTVEFGVSVPVTDKLAIRVAGRGEFMQGGWLRNNAGDVVRDLGPFETDALYPTSPPSYKKFPGKKQFVGRFTAVFTPSDNFDATLKVFGSKTRQNDGGAIALLACADGVGGHPYLDTAFFGQVPDPFQTCTGKLKFEKSGAIAPAAILAGDAEKFGHGRTETNYTTRNILTTLEMNLRLGDITLSSVSGYWSYKQHELINFDWTSYAAVTNWQSESGHNWTTEFRARSDFDFPVNFMAGVFYEDMFRQQDAPDHIFPVGPAPANGPWPDVYDGTFLTFHQHWWNWIKSISAFAELRWEITDQLELSGGVRYTDEKRRTHGGQLFNRLDQLFPAFGIPNEFNPFGHSGTFYDLHRDFSNTSPSATLSWKPTTDTLLYVAYKTGFQSAGISNPGVTGNYFSRDATGAIRRNPDGTPIQASSEEANGILTFDGSKVEGFEVGAKGLFFDGALAGDIALYRLKYRSLQVAVFDPRTTTFTIQNAAAAMNKGIEGSLTWQATDELQLRTSASYNHLQFIRFPDAQCYPGQNVPGAATYRPELAPLCVTDPIAGGSTQDMSGETYGGPPFQINMGFTYHVPIADSWTGELTGDVIHFNGGRETLRQPGLSVPSRTILNVSARLYQADGPWEVALICSNCTNERYLYDALNKPLARTGDLVGLIGEPRLITIQTTYRW